ncbi:uncharacterized protein JCM10292_003242 [Rhodotorula paludigena]|uniref:uncharacterized protein n=1 Tax=Rhodotorula paludigena TaxID=86838 RepID=UPI00317908ED
MSPPGPCVLAAGRFEPPPPSVLALNSIPFSTFADLVRSIGSVEARRKGAARSSGSGKEPKQHRLLRAWTEWAQKEAGGAQGLPEGTVVLFFRLFFPDEGVRRRYNLQEWRLGEAVEEMYGAKTGSFRSWNASSASAAAAGSGCFGLQVARWLEGKALRNKGKARELTLGQVDKLLDELAASSGWSSEEVKALNPRSSCHARSVQTILADLITPLSPSDAAVMLQIVLRDLSPLLYPAPSVSAEAALRLYNNASYYEIDLYDAMRLWHPDMQDFYRVVHDLDYVAWETDKALRRGHSMPRAQPQLGVPVKVPKTERPGFCAHATRHLAGEVGVETKYDGERLQIHIDQSLPPEQQIRIFSKSGRDSTWARRRLLPIIRASLDLPLNTPERDLHPLLRKRFSALHRSTHLFPPTKLIIEGEMVPYDETRAQIDEFWKLTFARRGHDAQPLGVDVRAPNRYHATTSPVRRDEETYETGNEPVTQSPRRTKGLLGTPPSTTSPRQPHEDDKWNGNLHLMIVWFDLLVVDGESLLDEAYSMRRARLESLVRPTQGFSMLADRVVLDFSRKSSALSDLRIRFAHIITKRCEGLMLKPLSSLYNDMRPKQRWIKLKKDFIPGAGDTLDFHIVGASWQKHRGRELLVPPTVWTTFFVGLRADKLGILPDGACQPKSHYHILFSVSYGLSRKQLAQLCSEIELGLPLRFDGNFDAKTRKDETIKVVKQKRWKSWHPVFDAAATDFTFSLAGHLCSNAERPHVIFRTPRVVELNGAGFQRAAGGGYYELRWPRMTKFTRSDGDPVSLAELQRVAQEAMGSVGCGKNAGEALVDDIWDRALREAREAAGGGEEEKETDDEKYERELKMWVDRLEEADGVHRHDRVDVDRFLARPGIRPVYPLFLHQRSAVHQA